MKTMKKVFVALLVGAIAASSFAVSATAAQPVEEPAAAVIAQQSVYSVRALSQDGTNLTSVFKNEVFLVEAITPDTVTNVKLLNEYDLQINLQDAVRYDRGDGTAAWVGKISVGTAGANRTFTLIAADENGVYSRTDATFSIEVKNLQETELTGCSLRAVDENGNTLTTVTVGHSFRIEATTPSSVTSIKLLNETKMQLTVNDLVRTDNGDGTVSWSGTTIVSTAGQNRKLQLIAANQNGVYSYTDAEIVFEALPAPQIFSVEIPTTGKVNVPFTVTVQTNSNVEKLEMYNEYGLKMSIPNASFVTNAQGRLWTFQLQVGTAGSNRYFVVYGVGANGERSAPMETGKIDISIV